MVGFVQIPTSWVQQSILGFDATEAIWEHGQRAGETTTGGGDGDIECGCGCEFW